MIGTICTRTVEPPIACLRASTKRCLELAVALRSVALSPFALEGSRDMPIVDDR